MGMLSYHIPNLANGVSQQPPALRLPTACQDMQNAWPSVVSGLQKRPPSEHLANLGFSITDNAAGHIINRGAGYEFIAIANQSDIKVFDMQGNSYSVSYPNGKAYLSSVRNPVEDLKFLTFGDYTFVLNKRMTVKNYPYGEAGDTADYSPTYTVDTSDEIPAAAPVNTVYYVTSEELYYRRETIPGTPNIYGWQETGSWQTSAPTGYTYVSSLPAKATVGKKVYISVTSTKTVLVTEYNAMLRTNEQKYVTQTETKYKKFDAVLVSAATSSHDEWMIRSLNELVNTSTSRLNPDNYGTVYVTQSVANTYYTIYINNVLKASFLSANGVDASNSVQSTSVIAAQLASQLNSNGYTATVYGSSISISNLTATDTITTQAGQGDKSLRHFRDSIQSFSDLPPHDKEGRLVKVVGSPETNGDDYFVVYRKGVWVEEEGWNQAGSFYATTMPHVLIRNADNTWTFKPFTWDGRTVGSTDSNANPSFVGRTINDIFVFSNRMGMLSDENIIFSESDNFHNFYRTTVAQLLDSDRIDVAVFNKDVNILRHAVPFSKDILLMSDNSQFRFSYQNFLSPKNINIDYTTSFNVSPHIRPINMGNSVYFIDDAPTYYYTKVVEYFTKENQTGDEGDDVTAAVPEYIPTGVQFMAASPRMKSLVVNSFNDPTALYIYKFYWSGNQKVQNAWGRWSFPNSTRIYWAGFLDNYLYIVINRDGNLCLEKIKFDEDVYTNEAQYTSHLDRRLTIDDVSMTYDPVNELTAIVLPYTTSGTVEVISSTEDVIAFRNTVTKVASNEFTVPGDITDSTALWVGLPYTFSYEFSRQYMHTQKGNLMLEGRLQLRYMSLEYHNTAYFKFTVSQPGRDPVTTVFDGVIVGGQGAVLGQASFATGTKRIPLMANAGDVKLTITNDGPFGNAFGAAEWQAIYSPKSKRINN
jgi:hypothetical protein